MSQPDCVTILIEEHLRGFWNARKLDFVLWTSGPMQAADPEFGVMRFAPGTRNGPWIYVTHGAWKTESATGRKKFFLVSQSDDDRHVETLTMMTHLYADTRYDLHPGSLWTLAVAGVQDPGAASC